LKTESKFILSDLHQCSPWVKRGLLRSGLLRAALRDPQRCRLQRARIIVWLDRALDSRLRLEPWCIKSINPMKARSAADGFLKFNGRCGPRRIEGWALAAPKPGE
jgi:hypothetical protein